MVGAIRDMASTDGPHSIVVVTGGADLCNPEAGELIRQEAERAGIELRLFVIGFEVPPDEVEAVKAFVELIPGATYTDAPQAAALRTALVEIQIEVDRMAVEAFEPRPEPGGRTGANACDHPYLPLRSGASWSYDSSEGGLTWNVTSAGGSAEVGLGDDGLLHARRRPSRSTGPARRPASHRTTSAISPARHSVKSSPWRS